MFAVRSAAVGAVLFATASVALDGSAAPGIAGPPPARAAAQPTGNRSGYLPPVPGSLHVVNAFDPPREHFGAGHLGADLAATQGAAVLAANAGVVRFAGPVAGRGVVVLVHPDGVSTEYEPIDALVHVGQQVQRGQPIGRLDGSHHGCAESCLHWGARFGGDYVDPVSLLGGLGPVRLLPWPRAP